VAAGNLCAGAVFASALKIDDVTPVMRPLRAAIIRGQDGGAPELPASAPSGMRFTPPAVSYQYAMSRPAATAVSQHASETPPATAS
jgi:hypothetical protein